MAFVAFGFTFLRPPTHNPGSSALVFQDSQSGLDVSDRQSFSLSRSAIFLGGGKSAHCGKAPGGDNSLFFLLLHIPRIAAQLHDPGPWSAADLKICGPCVRGFGAGQQSAKRRVITRVKIRQFPGGGSFSAGVRKPLRCGRRVVARRAGNELPLGRSERDPSSRMLV